MQLDCNAVGLYCSWSSWCVTKGRVRKTTESNVEIFYSFYVCCTLQKHLYGEQNNASVHLSIRGCLPHTYYTGLPLGSLASERLLGPVREEIADSTRTISNCEGYSGIRIRTDDPYIRNVASGGAHCIYIVWLYEPRTLVNSIQLIPHNTPALNLILMNPMIL